MAANTRDPSQPGARSTGDASVDESLDLGDLPIVGPAKGGPAQELAAKRAARDAGSDPTAVEAGPRGPLKAGDSISGVQLQETMAAGKAVSCWRGKKSDGGSVTVYLLRAGASEQEQDTFRRGAARQAALAREHPFRGIAPVAKVVPGQDGYIVEIAAAGTMDDLPMLNWPLAERVAFFRRVSAALGAVHSSGQAHGCLRPASVLLDDEELAPVLSEVSVVNLRDSFRGASVDANDYAPYAAAEVRRGQLPDSRSDIFSLGRLLYFLLLGEHPAEPDEEVPRLKKLADEPEGLVRIVRRCTVRNPTDRYRAVEELLDDIAKHQNAPIVGLAPPDEKAGAAAIDDEHDPLTGQRLAPPPRAEPAPVQRKPAAPAPRPRAPQAAKIVVPVEDDRVGRQGRLLALAGLVVFGTVLAVCYLTARAGLASTIGAGIGGVALSLLVPPLVTSKPLISRAVLAVLAIALVMWFEPTVHAAQRGRVRKLTQGDPRQRAEALMAQKKRGVVEFREVDLSEVDFSGMDLAFLVFDGSKLEGANFQGSRLDDCSMADVALARANFSGASLTGIDPAQTTGWDQIRCDDETLLPAGWKCVSGLPKPTSGMGVAPEDDEQPERAGRGAAP